MSGARNTVVGSDQIFDHTCDICEAQDTAAEGYCRQCEQFYCTKCSKCHKKMRLTRNHRILGKEAFAEISRKPSLFKRKTVPLALHSLPKEYYVVQRNVTRVAHEFNISAVLTSSNPDTIVMLIVGRQKLYVIDDDSTVNSYDIKEKCHTVIQHPSNLNELVFTVPSTNEVKNMNLSKPGELVTLFKTSGECRGIAEFDNGYAVSVKMATGLSLPDWQIQYLDTNGKVMKRIMYDNEDKAMFKVPKLLASNSDKDLLYVNDSGMGDYHVTVLNVLGEILFRWKRDGGSHPSSLSVDNEQNMYLVYAGAVVQVNNDRSEERVIVSSNDITCASFNSEADTLAITDKTGRINVLHLTP